MAGVPVRVLIADDRELSVAGTTAALGAREGFKVVGIALCASQAGDFAQATRPDVALVDAALPGGGEAAVRAILTGSPDTRVLARSGAADHEALIPMLQAGADGYVVRDVPPQQLTSALRSAAAGDTSFNGVVGGGAHAARLSKRARIRRVMESGQLDIVFQPIVALDSRAVVGYEALSRFAAEPGRGPDAWFAEAHEVGLGPELELCAIQRACERARSLPESAFLAVNVSPVTAERRDLLALIVGCDVDHVVLEVTEHARVEDYPRFRVAIARVRELGASLAVDDAGVDGEERAGLPSSRVRPRSSSVGRSHDTRSLRLPVLACPSTRGAGIGPGRRTCRLGDRCEAGERQDALRGRRGCRAGG